MDGEQRWRDRRRSTARVPATRRASSAFGYDGSARPVTVDEVTIAEVTTRDINRGDAPHFLLKEISEARMSFAKTLRGKIVEHDGLLSAVVGDVALPPPSASEWRTARSPGSG